MSAKKKTSVQHRVAGAKKGVPRTREGAVPSRDYYEDALEKAIDGARSVAQRAQDVHGDMRSGHEGWGVLAEEFDEFTEAVRMKQSASGRADRIYDECLDVAASALRIAAHIHQVSR